MYAEVFHRSFTSQWCLLVGGKNASAEFEEASREVVTLHTVLKEVADEIQNPDSILRRSSQAKQGELEEILRNSRSALQELEELLTKYQSLETDSKRTRDRIKFGTKGLQDGREKLTFHTSAISLFFTTLGAGSLARIEKKLDEVVHEIKTGKRAPMLLTDEEQETDAFWNTLKTELLEEGLTKHDLEIHKHKVLTHLQDLVKSRDLQKTSFLPRNTFILDFDRGEAIQELVHKLLAKHADVIIDERWSGGYNLQKEDCPNFAADVLIYCRRRYYEEAARIGSISRLLSMLSLEDMKWLFDMVIRPRTKACQQSLFLCHHCAENSKPYGFEAVIQPFAAKHTTALSRGRMIVYWQAEWPEEPPFHPNPSAVKSAICSFDRPMAFGSQSSPSRQSLKRQASGSFDEYREETTEYDEYGRVKKKTVISRGNSPATPNYSTSQYGLGSGATPPLTLNSDATPPSFTGSGQLGGTPPSIYPFLPAYRGYEQVPLPPGTLGLASEQLSGRAVDDLYVQTDLIPQSKLVNVLRDRVEYLEAEARRLRLFREHYRSERDFFRKAIKAMPQLAHTRDSRPRSPGVSCCRWPSCTEWYQSMPEVLRHWAQEHEFIDLNMDNRYGPFRCEHVNNLTKEICHSVHLTPYELATHEHKEHGISPPRTVRCLMCGTAPVFPSNDL